MVEGEFRVVIRRMELRDAPQVSEIEKRAFSQPWPENEFAKAAQADNYIYLVAEHENKIIGYAGCVFAADEADITNIAVDETARRRGIGRKLLQCLIKQAAEAGLAKLFLEVRTGNAPALELYRTLSFEQIGLRPNFYAKPVEDAILMVKILQ